MKQLPKITPTLPVVWLATIGVLILAYTNNWKGTDLALALAVPAALWGVRKATVKRNDQSGS